MLKWQRKQTDIRLAALNYIPWSKVPLRRKVKSVKTADVCAARVNGVSAVVQELRFLRVLSSIFASVHKRRDGAQRGDLPMFPWPSLP